jgi:hypothetical protein
MAVGIVSLVALVEDWGDGTSTVKFNGCGSDRVNCTEQYCR